MSGEDTGDLHAAVRAAREAAHLHGIRVGLQDLLRTFETVEEFVRVSETARTDLSGTMGMLTFELQLLRDLGGMLDVAAPDYLITRGDQRSEDVELYRRFDRRRSALRAWYEARMQKWRNLGYDPETLILTEPDDA